jgi:hypothetical protein
MQQIAAFPEARQVTKAPKSPKSPRTEANFMNRYIYIKRAAPNPATALSFSLQVIRD